jgi:membrane protease YdiL (CAAX protease family)
MQIVAVLAIVLVNAVASGLAFRGTRAGEPSFWWLACGPTIALALVAIARAWRDGTLGGSLRPRAGDASLGIFTAFLLFAAAFAFSHYVAPPGSSREMWITRVYLQVGDPASLEAHVTLLNVGLVVVAAAEEIVWRGLVMQLLAERYGTKSAWILQAVAYAVSYVPTIFALAPAAGQVNPVLVLLALPAGLAWGYLAHRTGRLPAAIVSHGLFDWLVVVMFRLWGGGSL